MVGSRATSPARSPSRSPQRGKTAAAKKTRPTVRDLIVQVVTGSNQRNGVSLAALKKALKASGYNVEKNKERIKAAVKALVTDGTLVHTKGTGASGSFKLGKNTEKARKKGVSKVKKSAAKRGKARSPKKASSPKKARRSPKKAKKQAAKKAKSAKETKKRTATMRVKSPKKAKTIRRGVSKSKKAAVKKK